MKCAKFQRARSFSGRPEKFKPATSVKLAFNNLMGLRNPARYLNHGLKILAIQKQVEYANHSDE